MGKSKELATLTDVGGTIDGALTVDGGYTDLETQDVNNYARITTVNGSAQLGLYRSGSAEGGFYLGGDVDKFRVYDSSFTPRMEVDASGRVTMPYQPSFRVVLQTSNGTSSTTTQLVNWGVQHNIGGHFSTSTSRFTAPVSGVYLMNYTGLHSSNGANTGYWVRMYFMINGTAYLDGLGDNGTYGSYQRLSVSAQFYLNAGDYVTTHAQSNQTNSTGVYSGYTHWSGHLIG